ncbi:MAG TPA: sigma-54 dependent transcriptional regulator [Candidatus Kapabacteria bacterium]|nr:sigma-54 dependent transcriptional regulator [Candidatus Kapabacteria bacterium]
MKILIADDNIEFSGTMSDLVESFGYKTAITNTPSSAIDYYFKNNNQLMAVFLDIEFGANEELDGLDLLEKFRKFNPTIPTVMISGKGTIESAVRATKLGAANFIEKSLITKDRVQGLLESLFGNNHNEQNETLIKFLNSNGIIGKSKAILDMGDAVVRYGRTDLNILITGETGTGKKLVAKAIHAISRRAKSSFITVDIPNITKELFQSELFGHIKGSFTGATETKKGLFHEANKGTLFLDEIGELPVELQSNLFLPLEEKYIRKVGSTQQEDIDIRFVSATDKNLINSIKDGRFREQLYHRLRECEIELPSLEKRKEDIPEIVEYYLQKHNIDYSDNKLFSPSSIEFLTEQSWPGNVRELSSTIKRVCQTTQKEQIETNDIIKNLGPRKEFSISIQGSYSEGLTLKEDAEKHNKFKIEETLKTCNGNVSKSAALLGVSRETLHNKIKKYDIDTQQYRVKR